MKVLSFISLALAALSVHATCMEEHQVTSVPGYNDPDPINFDQYAGRLPLPSNGQNMFYWLVESESDPSTDPLVLWLNGGPGCSSLIGFFTELGPFIVQSDLTVKRNPYAWNRKANIVFLESPAGVGFSQPASNATEYTDVATAARAAEFLAQFLELYPSYKNRDVYITGESYAGMYIPFLVDRLLTTPVTGLNLKGFAIGNPYTDAKIDGGSYIDYYYSHGLSSLKSFLNVQATCKPSELWQCPTHPGNCSPACRNAVYDVFMELDFDNWDAYNIYGDVCLLQPNEAKTLQLDSAMLPRSRSTSSDTPFTPCADTFAAQYLNLPDVQHAIHAIDDDAPSIQWDECSNVVTKRYKRSATSLDKYPIILKAGLKALIYSGDADAVVPFMGTQRWLANDGLNLTVTLPWKSWLGPNKQLAGYGEVYGNITFKTIKGAGHMVPATRPLHALYMFECFVYGDQACQNFAYPTRTSTQ
ncbi:Aste57867_373 [Aphanomyces stellatus]|uniref:Carboxypeptidase n=1 Tax=Aphanomyces stellatus TaxID=120398 RepID=A0A485K7M6_9STRA|nr:hypothetical protein As57867_000372 [Aphanomyces stellatus]VFT77598.1 Aste57867_373 [Aphanomyces stellatus]